MDRMVYLKDVVTLEMDEEKCTGCGICVEVCPHRVLEMTNGRAAIVRRDECMECGACATNCPAEAISVAAGVGCAAAVISSALPWGASVCCSVEDEAEKLV